MRVTWFWYSSIGLILRLPYWSFRLYGPKTPERRMRALPARGWRGGTAGWSDMIFPLRVVQLLFRSVYRVRSEKKRPNFPFYNTFTLGGAGRLAGAGER